MVTSSVPSLLSVTESHVQQPASHPWHPSGQVGATVGTMTSSVGDAVGAEVVPGNPVGEVVVPDKSVGVLDGISLGH